MNSSRLYIVNKIFSLLPPTRFFRFKSGLLRWAGGNIGQRVRIVSSARFNLTGSLSIGSGTWIGHEALIVGGDADVTIGADVDIAPRVTIVTGTHELWSQEGKAAGRGFSLPIRIGNGVWIGAGTTILGGVTVGNCSAVAAGAVVSRDIPKFSLFGGVPARFMRTKVSENIDA